MELLSTSVAELGLNSTQLCLHCSDEIIDNSSITKSIVKMQD